MFNLALNIAVKNMALKKVELILYLLEVFFAN